jgi:hypothetical protein
LAIGGIRDEQHIFGGRIEAAGEGCRENIFLDAGIESVKAKVERIGRGETSGTVAPFEDAALVVVAAPVVERRDPKRGPPSPAGRERETDRLGPILIAQFVNVPTPLLQFELPSEQTPCL